MSSIDEREKLLNDLMREEEELKDNDSDRIKTEGEMNNTFNKLKFTPSPVIFDEDMEI